MRNKILILMMIFTAFACDDDLTVEENNSELSNYNLEHSTKAGQTYATTIVVTNATELTAAVNQITAGTLIVIKDGTYADVDLDLNVSATQSLPIKIKAENQGGVIFNGTSKLSVTGDYISIEGITFPTSADVINDEGSNNNYQYCLFSNSIGDIDGAVVRLDGQHTNFHHCKFNGKTTSGNYINVSVDQNQGSFHKIYRNYFSRPNGSGNGRSAMRIGHGSMANYEAFVLIERNVFENCDGESEIISVKSSSNYIRNNTFKMCRGHFSLRQGNGSVVEANFFIGDGVKRCGGIAVRGEDHFIFNNYFSGMRDIDAGVINFGVADDIDQNRINKGLPGRQFGLTTNIVVCFNTIMNHKSICDYDFSYGYGSRNRTHPPSNIHLYNNVSDNSVLYANGVSSVSGLDMQSNYFAGKSTNTGGATVVPFTIREVQLAGITVPKANSDFKNISIALPANLSQPSLASGNFSDRDVNISKDIFGLLRDVNKDSGCIELALSGNRTNIPLSANDVGCGF